MCLRNLVIARAHSQLPYPCRFILFFGGERKGPNKSIVYCGGSGVSGEGCGGADSREGSGRRGYGKAAIRESRAEVGRRW